MNNMKSSSGNDNIAAGLILLLIGVLLLLKKLGFALNGWLFTWPSLFIVIGSIILIRSNFKSGFGYFMFLLGGYFLLRDLGWIPVDFKPFIAPIILITVGLFLLLGKSANAFTGTNFGHSTNAELHEDAVDINTAFSEVSYKVYSEQFSGGKAKLSFAGGEIDLSDCDLTEHAVLNVDVSFAGLKLIVPAHWTIKSDVSNTFAATEDKRSFKKVMPDSSKVLIIKGSVTFGGLEIKSY